MNIWKSKANLGRGGDNKIRNVEGKPSHVNPYEAYLIDSYKQSGEAEVKRIGSGTTNPATGLKEYQVDQEPGGFDLDFLSPLATGIGIASTLLGGFSRMGNKSKVKKAKAAALEVYEEQIAMLEERKDLSTDISGTQYTTGVGDVSTATGIAERDVTASGDVARSQTGLVTSSVDEKIKVKTGDIVEQYKTDMQKLLDTRKFTEAETDLAFRTGSRSAEESYQNTLTQLESIPTGFFG